MGLKAEMVRIYEFATLKRGLVNMEDFARGVGTTGPIWLRREYGLDFTPRGNHVEVVYPRRLDRSTFDVDVPRLRRPAEKSLSIDKTV